jgi:N-methylhydantoinase A
MRIGVDVGGTFTDVILVDDVTGTYHYTKTPTTPANLAEGVINGLEKILQLSGNSMSQLDYLVHGSTIGTNALLERKGAKVGLITTEGFIDVLEIRRVGRPREGLYDFWVDHPPPLVPRYLRMGVVERVNSKGEVLVPLDVGSAVEAVDYLKRQGVEAIAISLLFSFRNPIHETQVAEICRDRFPEAHLSLSSEICPEFREYERTSTTVINAYLLPVSERYVENLVSRLAERYGEVDLRIMQASGGSMTAEVAKKNAVHMVNSGPAGGAMAGAFISRITGRNLVVGVDMGGTSFDICLIDGGTPKTTTDAMVAGFPVRIPMIDIHTIGAGGGSIAWVDEGGVLNVGPQSAGAVPGPACYGRGGTLPTVTDANLLLGRLNPDYFLGGELKLYAERAYRAVKEHVADRTGMSVEEAARGIIKIVNAAMVKGIAATSVEKGYDVREFALVAFGGAGPVHAVELAQELRIREVIVPPLCGNLSALGLLVSDTQHDYVRTLAKKHHELDTDLLLSLFRSLEEEGIQQLRRERVKEEDLLSLWSADLRYKGQSYEINTPVQRLNGAMEDIQAILDRFHELHQRFYSYCEPHETVEFVNLRVRAIGRTPEVRLAPEAGTAGDPSQAIKGKRPVYFEGLGMVEVPIYDRELLRPGHSLQGPCLVEERISTTLMIQGSFATVDHFGNIIVSLGRG